MQKKFLPKKQKENLVSGLTWGGGRLGSDDSASVTTDPEATTKHSKVDDHIQEVDVFLRFVTRNCLIHPADFIFIITSFSTGEATRTQLQTFLVCSPHGRPRITLFCDAF